MGAELSAETFARGFAWGVSIGAHQSEGSNLASDWWYPASAGFTDYRFGVEWSRIEPADGRVSRAKVGHYRRIVEGAVARGLRPTLTLHPLHRSALVRGHRRLGAPGRSGPLSALPRRVALARLGATVVITGRDAGRGVRTAKAIEDDGGSARFVAADLSNPGQLAHLAQESGDVDILVNNAGRSWFGPTAELDAGTFDALFASNVRSAYLLTAAIAPGMAR
jgi:short chain dehydrogenase/Glycosyl hydrolase family 1